MRLGPQPRCCRQVAPRPLPPRPGNSGVRPWWLQLPWREGSPAQPPPCVSDSSSERCERRALLPGSPGSGEPARALHLRQGGAAAPPSLATSPRAGGRGGVPTRGVPETSQRGNVLSVARGKGPRGQRPLPGATVQRLVPRTGWGCRGRGAPRCLCGREPRASEATFPISCALRSID